MASALAGGAALLAGSATASAQDYTYLLLVDYGPGETSVHPGNPSCTVRVWATLKESEHAWAGGNLDLHADEAGWITFDLLLGVHGLFARSRGTLSPDLRTLEGIRAGQFNDHFVETARTDHPILIWEGTWSNLSGDYLPRSVGLTTSETSFYWVFSTDTNLITNQIGEFMPGSGAIAITPAPPVALLAPLCGAMCHAGRRHRRWSLPSSPAASRV